MHRLGHLYFSLTLMLVCASAAGAAGEIDSHRVWGEGLFGMHIAPPDNGSAGADGSGVYRDEFGALRDKSMLPDMLTDDQTSQQVDNVRSTNSLYSPENMYTSPGLSANNMSYIGGYGQYGPINNLDLIRAGITSDLKTATGSQSLNPIGVISNYARVVMPSEPIPGRSVFMVTKNPPGLGPTMNAQKSMLPLVEAQPVPRTIPPMVAAPITKSLIAAHTPQVVVTQVRARRIAPDTQVKPARSITSECRSLTSIGPVNGYIRYGDEKVTLFGSRGTLSETPKGAVVMRLPNNTVVLQDSGTLRRQIAGIEKTTF